MMYTRKPNAAARQQSQRTTRQTQEVNRPTSIKPQPHTVSQPRYNSSRGFITLSSTPVHGIGNFFGQTFFSFWRFDTCCTRLDFWLGYIALIIASTKLSGVFYHIRNRIMMNGVSGGTAWFLSMLALILTFLLAVYFVLAQLALAVRRLRDTNSELAMMAIVTGVFLLACIVPPLEALIPFLGKLLHTLVPPIFILIPSLLAAFKSPVNYSGKPGYMVFHWNHFGRH